MKQQKRIIWILGVLLLLCLSLGACAASNDPLAVYSFRSVTVNARGRVTAAVTLDVRQVQAHTGEKAYLYELLPGEDASALSEREPLDEAKVSSRMEFTFDLIEEGHTRLYSDFAVGFADGSFLTLTRGLDNPSALADGTGCFLWENDPKGLVLGDVYTASGLGMGHGMVNVSFSALRGEGTVFTFDGVDYSLSSSALAGLDRQMKAAMESGMQISLRWIPDDGMTITETVALLDFLAERYAAGGVGAVSAFFLDTGDAMEADRASELLRLSYLALSARNASGRVYLLTAADRLSAVEGFFADVAEQIEAMGAFAWHAAVAPVTEAEDEDAMTPSALLALNTSLGELSHAPSSLSVCDLSYPMSDPDAQAVWYLYVYAEARAAGAELIFYDATGEDCGWRAEDGISLPLEVALQTVNTGVDSNLLYLCRVSSSEIYAAVSALAPTRTLMGGGATVGGSTSDGSMLFDFSDGDTLGFSGHGALYAPVTYDSATFGSPVLYTWLDPTKGDVGVRRLLSDGEDLSGVSQLSVELLAQYGQAGTTVYTLSLMGTDRQGLPLSYSARVEGGSDKWCTLTFQVSLFTEAADLSHPCTVTLTAEREDASDPFVLWIRAFRTVSPGFDLWAFVPILAIPLAAGVTAVLIWLFYRRTANRNAYGRRR